MHPTEAYLNIRQVLKALRGETDSDAVTVEGFNTFPTPTDKSDRIMKTQALNDMLDQGDFTNIYRTFHSKAAEYTFFANTHGTSFSRIDRILGHTSSLSKFNKTKTISSIFSDHSTMKLEIS